MAHGQSIPKTAANTIPDTSVSPSATLDLESLPRLSLAELRRLWVLHMGRAKCPVQKRILIRELAWRYQERLYGGLDAETKRLLDAAVRAALKRRKSHVDVVNGAGGDDGGDDRDSNGDVVRADNSSPTSRRSQAASTTKHMLKRLPVGARLIRAWPPGSSTKHEVSILEGGKTFEYKGTAYKSLSEVARAITGTRWSGPRFFGLTGRKAGGA